MLPFGVAVDDQIISIHALREEGDPPSGGASSCWNYFYPRPPRGGRRMPDLLLVQGGVFLSTPSARRATFPALRARRGAGISIHALREEGDTGASMLQARFMYFYPRPPRGGRHRGVAPVPRAGSISIHALREEGDSKNGESIPAFDQSINQAAQNGKSCERKTFLKLEICAERQAFPGAKVPGI